MTGIIAIDESGDLGSAGSKYFAMAAIVAFSPRNLRKAINLLPKNSERKWHNTLPTIRSELFSVMSEMKFNVVYSVVNKNHPLNKHPIYGNELYEKILKDVISDAISVSTCKDTNVLLDGCRFVSVHKLREISLCEAARYKINLKIVDKVSSECNKCIQLADYVAGACRSKYEHNDNTIDTIENKVSVARRH